MSHFFKKGFTLTELLVTISIVTFLLTVVILNQSKYTDGIAVTGLADEIAVTMSQAQAYGAGVKQFVPETNESNKFNSAYGLMFSLLEPNINRNYMFFADRNANGVYDGDFLWDGVMACPTDSTSECITKSTISRGNTVHQICTISATNVEDCTNSSVSTSPARLDVVFRRPSTEANLFLYTVGAAPVNTANIIGARIKLNSPRGSIRSVTVYKTGQISVQ